MDRLTTGSYKPVTFRDLGLPINKLYDVATANVDYESVLRVFNLYEGDDAGILRSLFATIGVSFDEDTEVSISSINKLIFYLFLKDKAHYRLDKMSSVVYTVPKDKLLMRTDQTPQQIHSRLKKILEGSRTLLNYAVYACKAFDEAGTPERMSRVLGNMWNWAHDDVVRTDYAEIANHIYPEYLYSKRYRIRLTRMMLFNVFDFYRIMLTYKFNKNFNDLKTAILGSETRRKKVLEIFDYPLINLDLTTDMGIRINRALDLR